MKKFLALFLAFVMVMSVSSIAFAKTSTGIAGSQIGGPDSLEVEVTFDDNQKITGIKVLKHNETPGISDAAFDQIPALIQELQSVNVDVVAGATMTSEAIIGAVSAAIVNAGLDLAPFEEKKEVVVEKAADQTLEADVIIVGAGGAGLAAAVTAHENGASVIVLEKMGKVGGNTIMAGGALNAVDDRSETAIANNDSVQWHYEQTIKGGDNQGDPELVQTLVANAWDGVEWLKGMGMGFKEGTFTVLGGMWPRAHKPEEPVGTGFFTTYMNYINNNENVEVMLNTCADSLIVDADGKVTGVMATGETGNTLTVKANKGVIMATGGFSQNLEMRQVFNTLWADLGESVKSTNHAGATGDGITMMMKVGADLVQMGNIQLLPMGDPVTGSLSGNIEMGVETRIFVNKEGNRFVNEGGRRDEMTQALFAQTDNWQWIVMDSDEYPTGDEKNNFNESANELIAAGRAFKGETLEELASIIGVPADNLIKSVDNFNKHVASKEADEFGRTLYKTPIDNGPFYAAARIPTVHHTMGGVRITPKCEVINEKGNIIEGLYAAGEVTGGIHGANRLGGNALTDTVVFGRIAGENAALVK